MLLYLVAGLLFEIVSDARFVQLELQLQVCFGLPLPIY